MAKQLEKSGSSTGLFMCFVLLALGWAVSCSSEAMAYPTAPTLKPAHAIDTVQYYDHRQYWCEIVRRRVWDPYIGRWVIMEREVCHRRRPHHHY